LQKLNLKADGHRPHQEDVWRRSGGSWEVFVLFDVVAVAISGARSDRIAAAWKVGQRQRSCRSRVGVEGNCERLTVADALKIATIITLVDTSIC
jgi:hypothetical protein